MTATTSDVRAGQADWAPKAKTGMSFVTYLGLLREAFNEAMQQSYDARRKHPFADV